MPQNRQYYRKVKYPDKVTKPKCLVFVRIFLFSSVGIKITYFPTAPYHALWKYFYDCACTEEEYIRCMKIVKS